MVWIRVRNDRSCARKDRRAGAMGYVALRRFRRRNRHSVGRIAGRWARDCLGHADGRTSGQLLALDG